MESRARSVSRLAFISAYHAWLTHSRAGEDVELPEDNISAGNGKPSFSDNLMK